MSNLTAKDSRSVLKYVSLGALTCQATILTLSLRYARIRQTQEDLFFASTAVVMAEIIKLLMCLLFLFFENEKNVQKFRSTLLETIFKNKIDTAKVCFPSFLYVIQNNLLFFAITNLDAVTFLITGRLKILTTAIFAVILLHKKLLILQWTSFILLIISIVITQINDDKTVPTSDRNHVLGLCSVLGANVLSGFSGVFLEKMLKRPEISVWMRNVQMSLIGIPLAIVTCLLTNFNDIKTKGFFHGYDWFVVYIVFLQASCGLMVAMVLKYADNILKGFASSFAIIFSSIASVYLFNFQLTIKFIIGALLVIGSIFLYGYPPKAEDKTNVDQRNTEIKRIDNKAADIDEKNDETLKTV